MTVPVEDAPTATTLGFKERLETTGAVMARVAVLEEPLDVAVMVALVFVGTTVVLTVAIP